MVIPILAIIGIEYRLVFLYPRFDSSCYLRENTLSIEYINNHTLYNRIPKNLGFKSPILGNCLF